MMGDVVQVQLCIPVGRIDAASWLKQQSPGLVADCLSECQSNYEAKLAANADHKVRQVEDECQQRLVGVKEQYEDDLARLQRAHEQLQLQVAENEAVTAARLEQQRLDHDKARQAIEAERNSIIETLNKCIDSHSEQEARHSEGEARIREELTSLVERYEESIESIRGLTSGGTKKGNVGQDLVIQTLRQMCLGTIEDVSDKAETGDMLWEYLYPDTRRMLRCLVEVKFEGANKKTGRNKLYRDIDRRLKAGQINCAIFFSLTATVANKQKLDVSMYQGIPVIFASREASDAIPAVTLVELAFRQMHQVLPLVLSETDTDDPDPKADLVSRVSERFVAYLHDLEASASVITNLEAGANSLIQQARVLRRNLERMASDIGRIQVDFDLDRPIGGQVANAAASPVVDDAQQLDWSSETGQEIMSHIHNWYDAHNADNGKKKKGYPKYKDVHHVLRRESLLWLESGPGSGEEAFQLGVAECKRATRKRRREEAQQK